MFTPNRTGGKTTTRSIIAQLFPPVAETNAFGAAAHATTRSLRLPIPHMPILFIIICFLAIFSTSWAGERKTIRFRPGNPPQITEHGEPTLVKKPSEGKWPRRKPAVETPDQPSPSMPEQKEPSFARESEKDARVQTGDSAMAASRKRGEAKKETAVESARETERLERRTRAMRNRRQRGEETADEKKKNEPNIASPFLVATDTPRPARPSGEMQETPLLATRLQADMYAPSSPPLDRVAPRDLDLWSQEMRSLPTREEVEIYRMRLEKRLLERYNNLPEHAGNVAKVTVILSKPLEEALDGSRIRAEFDQLVYDPWGKRLPELEKEYYVVTFGTGGAKQVRSDPSIRVGLDLEKTYSEKAPLAADPFRNVPQSAAFRPAPAARMPDWWRPDYPELE